MPFEKDPNEIGVLWTKSGRKGDYMTGEINGQKVVVFAIESKNPKAPNWRVLKSQPKGDVDGAGRDAAFQDDEDTVPF